LSPNQLDAAAVTAAAAAGKMSQGKGGHLHQCEDLSSSFSASDRPKRIHLVCFPAISQPIIVVQTRLHRSFFLKSLQLLFDRLYTDDESIYFSCRLFSYNASLTRQTECIMIRRCGLG